MRTTGRRCNYLTNQFVCVNFVVVCEVELDAIRLTTKARAQLQRRGHEFSVLLFLAVLHKATRPAQSTTTTLTLRVCDMQFFHIDTKRNDTWDSWNR